MSREAEGGGGFGGGSCWLAWGHTSPPRPLRPSIFKGMRSAYGSPLTPPFLPSLSLLPRSTPSLHSLQKNARSDLNILFGCRDFCETTHELKYVIVGHEEPLWCRSDCRACPTVVLICPIDFFERERWIRITHPSPRKSTYMECLEWKETAEHCC
jgi:hypothetical protein